MADPNHKPEPDIYDLADPDDAPASPAAPASLPPSKVNPSPREAGGDATYDLEEVEEPPKTTPQADATARIESDPRFAPAAEPAAAPPPVRDPSKPKVKSSVFTPEEAEPAYVSPEVAARKREEARVRAAELAAIDDARRSRRNIIIVVAIVLVVAIGLALWKLL
jgi:hypothetical protein